MNRWPTNASRMAGPGLALAIVLNWPAAACAQAFPIVPPKLPPRGAAMQPAHTQPAQQQVPQPQSAQQTNQQAYPQQPVAQQPYPQTQAQPQWQSQPQWQPQATPQSSLGARPASPPAYAPQAYASPAAPPAQPLPAAAAGRCRVLPSPERQSLALVSGEPPLPREQLPLGEFRAQQVVHSPDGRWAVAFTKLRGAAQFAALTIDLEGCRMQRTIDLPAAGSDAEFDGDRALLHFAGGQRQVDLKDRSVR